MKIGKLSVGGNFWWKPRIKSQLIRKHLVLMGDDPLNTEKQLPLCSSIGYKCAILGVYVSWTHKMMRNPDWEDLI